MASMPMAKHESDAAADARSTWFGLIVGHVNEIAAASTRTIGTGDAPRRYVDLDRLPSGAEIVDSIRGEVDRTAVTLRWFAGGAVLVGLLGTLVGLSGAIHEAVEVLKAANGLTTAGSGGLDFEKLARALSPLALSFVCSGCGVLASLVLLLVRQAYESDVDAHLSAVERWLDVHMPEFFTGWKSPAIRLVEVAEEVRRSNAEVMERTREVLEAASKVVVEKLAPMGGQLVQVVEEGLLNASEKSAERLRDATAKQLRITQDALANVVDNMSKQVGAEQQQRIQAWNDLVSSNQRWTDALQKSTRDEWDRFSKENENARDQFEKAWRRLSTEIAGQVKQFEGLNTNSAEIASTLESARAGLDAGTKDLTERATAIGVLVAEKMNAAVSEAASKTADTVAQIRKQGEDSVVKTGQCVIDAHSQLLADLERRLTGTRQEIESLGGLIRTFDGAVGNIRSASQRFVDASSGFASSAGTSADRAQAAAVAANEITRSQAQVAAQVIGLREELIQI
jgi:hypothetical protein